MLEVVFDERFNIQHRYFYVSILASSFSIKNTSLETERFSEHIGVSRVNVGFLPIYLNKCVFKEARLISKEMYNPTQSSVNILRASTSVL